MSQFQTLAGEDMKKEGKQASNSLVSVYGKHFAVWGRYVGDVWEVFILNVPHTQRIRPGPFYSALELVASKNSSPTVGYNFLLLGFRLHISEEHNTNIGMG